MTSVLGADRSSWTAELMRRLPMHHDRLRHAPDVAEMLARGARLACEECGFERGLVVGLRDGCLTADATGVLSDPGSDLLRRRLLASPLPLQPDSLEAELARRLGRTRRWEAHSILAEELELEDPAFGVLAPDGELVGILVLDRPSRLLDDTDRSVVSLFGGMLAVVLEQVVLRARIGELSTELRHLTVSVQALAAETVQAPITLPTPGRHMPSFAPSAAGGTLQRWDASDLLTERETEIAVLLAQGRSNREIADRLFLSVDTVKDNVGRIARKLGVTNRVEVAVRFLGLASPPPGGGR